MRYLISKNANVEAENGGYLSWTALMIASPFGHSEAAKIVLEEGGSNVKWCTRHSETALTCVVEVGTVRAIPTSLHHGANIIQCKTHLEGKGRSIVHTVRRDTEVFEALLRNFRDTMAEGDFYHLLLRTSGAPENISLHCIESVEIAKLLVEQPRRQHDKQLLPVCQAQLVSRRQTPRRTGCVS